MPLLLASSAETLEGISYWTIVTLAMLNEIGPLASLWIVSHSNALYSSSYDIGPQYTTLAYAVSEPLWTFALARLPLPVWLPFPSTYALQAISACHSLAGVLLSRLYSKAVGSSDESGCISIAEHTTMVALDRKDPLPAKSPAGWVHATFLLTTETAALQNAALLIWLQQLQLPSAQRFPSDAGTNMGIIYGYLMFNAFNNYFVSNVSGRAWFFRGGQYLRLQLYYLAILVIMRMCVRAALGQDLSPLLGLP